MDVGAYIGGSGTWGMRFPEDLNDSRISVESVISEGFPTPFGQSAPFKRLRLAADNTVLWTPFHGIYGPKDVRRPMWQAALQVFHVLHTNGVKWIIVEASVGGLKVPGTLNAPLPPGSVVIPDDVYWESFPDKFYEELEQLAQSLSLPGPARLAQPCHPALRQVLSAAAREHYDPVYEDGKYICTRMMPVFETPIQNAIYRQQGFDVVGRTFAYEAVLARLYNMPIAELNIVSNYGEGLAPAESWVDGGMAEFYRTCAPRMGRVMVDALCHLVNDDESQFTIPEVYWAENMSNYPVGVRSGTF